MRISDWSSDVCSSDLLKLLLGFHAPTGGQILVDGEPLPQWGLAAFRRHLGVVQQHDLLYAGTIAENIAFFDPQLDLDQVLRCARLACVDDDIARLPMGYDSLVGDIDRKSTRLNSSH